MFIATPTHEDEPVIDTTDLFDDLDTDLSALRAQDPFADMDTDLEHIRTKKDTRQKFPCPECLGTGRYQGARVHQAKSHCFACRGKGFFLTDPAKLKQRRVAQARKKDDDFRQFHDANAEVIREIGNAADWSDFARSLTTQLHERKPWSEKQLAAARSMAAKLVAKREQRAAEQKAEAVEVDLNPIKGMFDKASANGYKRPTYRAEGLVISKAPAFGRNPGALYVKSAEGDAYLGKIVDTTFFPSREGRETKGLLLEIAKDPLAAALRYGQRTGTCSCCGRKLTNHGSIDAGIGPICKEKWGF